MRLTLKMLFFIILPTLLGCIAVISKDYETAREVLQYFNKTNLETELDIQEEKLNGFLSERIRHLAFLANQRELASGQSTDIQQYLATQYPRLKDLFPQILWADRFRKVRVQIGGGDVSAAMEQLFEKTAEPFVMTFDPAKPEPDWGLIIVPITKGEVIYGYIGGVVPLQFLKNRPFNGKHHPETLLFIFGPRNEVISSPLSMERTRELFPGKQSHSKVGLQQEYRDEYLAVYRKGESIDWTLAMALPKEASLAPLFGLKEAQRTLALISVLISLAGLWFLRRIILQPVRSLIASHQLVTSGNLDARNETSANKEFSQVSAAFNLMVRELANVRKMNEEMQNKVRAELEKIEVSNAVKDRFITTMSHELRAPLQGVSGAADIIESLGCGADFDQELDELLKIIRSNNDRLASLIDNILLVSLIDSRKISRRPEVFNIFQLVDDVIADSHSAAKEKGLSIDVCFGEGLSSHYHGEVGKIRQILANVLNNAIKFTMEGGVEVRVTANGEARAQEQQVEISVVDTGIGVDEGIGEELFDDFYLVEDQFNRKFQGSGLGLAVSRRLVKLLGGKIWFKRNPIKGTSFSFSLPLKVPCEKGEIA